MSKFGKYAAAAAAAAAAAILGQKFPSRFETNLSPLEKKYHTLK